MFKFLPSVALDSFAARALTVLGGSALIAATGLLAGCPSQSSEQASAPPPVARAAGFHGVVFGGRQPIQGATVVAYAASTSAGAVPTQIGTAVTSGPGGNFTMTFSPAPRTGEVVYAVATGGDAGAGTNAAIGLMTVAGIQNSRLAPVAQTVNINELSTVAATATLKKYIHFVDCTTITGNTQTGTCLALPGATGLAAKAATLQRLVNVETGQVSAFLAANSTTAGAPLTTILQKLNTQANLLAACVNADISTTPNACTTLFGAAGGSNTLMSAWLVARMPAVTAKAEALFSLHPTTPVYSPVLATVAATTASGFWTVGGERYAYTANSGSNNVSAFRLTRVGGGLTPVAGAPFAAGGDPVSVAVDPTGRYVYVANYSNSLSAYAIGAGGALTAIPGAACGTNPDPHNCIAAGNTPFSVAVDPTGRYVYVTDYFGDSVSAYAIAAGGALTAIPGDACGTNPDPHNCIPAGYAPHSVAVDPTGRYVYVTSDNNSISAYAIGAGGALTAVGGSPLLTGGDPVSVTVDPTGRYVYVANLLSNSVSAFAIGAGGALTAIPGAACGANPDPQNCIAAGNSPESVAVDPTGRYVYVANYSSNNVSAYTIGAGGVLTPVAGAPFAAGTNPESVAVDPTGRYVYVTNDGINSISAYAIGADGALTAVGGSPLLTGGDPVSVTVDPTGRYVYVANRGSNNVSAYTLGSGGAMSPVAGSACNGVTGVSNCVAAGSSPYSVAVDPSGRYAYVANFDNYTVSMYTVGAGGALAPIGTVANGYEPISVAVDPTGRYVYVANFLGSDVSMYTIGADGALNPMTGNACAGVTGVFNCVTSGFEPSSVTVDPTGRYAYVANSYGNDISMYTIGAGGTLNPVAGSSCFGTSAFNCVAAESGPFSVTVDPTGRYVYVANGGDDNVSMYTIGAGGKLNPVAGSDCSATDDFTNCVAAGFGPFSVTVDPSGRYAYVANRTGGDVSMYTIGANGALSPVTGSACSGVTGVGNCVAAGDFPRSVTVDPTGRYAYVANYDGDDVSVYTIGAGGVLIPVAGNACKNVTGVSSCVATGRNPASIVVGP